MNAAAQSPLRAVVGIIRRDDTILICERPQHKSYAGYWEFPGGKIEANESDQEALKRELHEELGITIVSSQPWFEHSHAYPDKIVQLSMWEVLSFLGEPEGCENQKIRWATLAEIKQMQILEGNWAIIEKLKCLLNDL